MSVADEKPSDSPKAFLEADSDASNRSTGKARRNRSFVDAACVVFVGIGAAFVPWGDVLFVVLASFYIYAMSKLVFPKVTSKSFPPFFANSRDFRHYMNIAIVVGLVLPLVFIVVSTFILGDHTAAREATPHLFLLCAQVLTEAVTMRPLTFSIPIRALGPILYNSRRLYTLWNWTGYAFSKSTSSLSFAATAWLLFERGLAVSNVLFWNFNLWVFLLGIFLPRALRKHYEAVK